MTENYQGDYYQWLTTTAQAIDERRFDAIDARQVAEELRDIGKGEQRSIETHFELILIHLLMIRYQPGRHTRSWDLSIAGYQSRIAKRALQPQSMSIPGGCTLLSIEISFYSHGR